jgi:hypothetical protein
MRYKLLRCAAITTSLLAPATASATQIYVSGDSLPNGYEIATFQPVDASSTWGGGTEYTGEQALSTNLGTIYAWCVDVSDIIYLGSDNILYTQVPLDVNGATEIAEIATWEPSGSISTAPAISSRPPSRLRFGILNTTSSLRPVPTKRWLKRSLGSTTSCCRLSRRLQAVTSCRAISTTATALWPRSFIARQLTLPRLLHPSRQALPCLASALSSCLAFGGFAALPDHTAGCLIGGPHASTRLSFLQPVEMPHRRVPKGLVILAVTLACWVVLIGALRLGASLLSSKILWIERCALALVCRNTHSLWMR